MAASIVPTMTVAGQLFDRTRALFDGRVPLDRIIAVHVPGGKSGVDGVLTGLFDAAEIPIARYLFVRDQGDPVTAVPVFTERIMDHPYVYVHVDSGIASLADLRGQRVWVPGYYYTAMLWHRGLLWEEYHIGPTEIEWYLGANEVDPRMLIPDGVGNTIK